MENGVETWLIADPDPNVSKGTPSSDWDTLSNSYNNQYDEVILFTEDAPGRTLSVSPHSPIAVLVTDSRGRRTGYDPQTDTVLEEIPASSYGTEHLSAAAADGGEIEQLSIDLWVATDADYHIQVVGTGIGDYGLEFTSSSPDGSDTAFVSGSAVPAEVEDYFAEMFPEASTPLGVVQIALTTPTLVAPGDGVVVTDTTRPTLEWTPIQGALQYELEFALGTTRWRLTTSDDQASYTPDTPLMGAEYSWRVRALGEGIEASDWSESRTFVMGAGLVAGLVELQGRPAAPDAHWVVPLHVVVTPQGGGAAVFDTEVTTDESGQFELDGLAPGDYRVWVKGAHTLAVAQDVTIVAGANLVSVGVLREGDIDDNNVVNLTDFSLLAATFGKQIGDAGYAERADFNGDGVVNLLDFSLLASNFGQAGDT